MRENATYSRMAMSLLCLLVETKKLGFSEILRETRVGKSLE